MEIAALLFGRVGVSAANDVVLRRWEAWVRKEFPGPEDRIAAILKAVFAKVLEKGTADEAMAEARWTAQAWDQDQKTHRPDRVEAPPTVFGGIFDVIAADKSELGRATFAALKAVETSVSPTFKSFLAMRTFRGHYGWDRRKRALPLARLLIGLLLVLVLLRWLFFSHSNQIALIYYSLMKPILIILVLYFVLYPIYILIKCSLMASHTKLLIEKGRILITYGVFKTGQLAIEINWVHEVMWYQGLTQKLLNESNLTIDYTQGNNPSLRRIFIPGPVPPAQMQLFVDKLRNAAQKIRGLPGDYWRRAA